MNKKFLITVYFVLLVVSFACFSQQSKTFQEFKSSLSMAEVSVDSINIKFLDHQFSFREIKYDSIQYLEEIIGISRTPLEGSIFKTNSLSLIVHDGDLSDFSFTHRISLYDETKSQFIYSLHLNDGRLIGFSSFDYSEDQIEEIYSTIYTINEKYVFSNMTILELFDLSLFNRLLEKERYGFNTYRDEHDVSRLNKKYLVNR